MRLCDYLNIDLIIDAPREHYYNESEKRRGEYRRIVGTWYLMVNDSNGRPTTFSVDIKQGSFLSLIAIDILKSSATDYLSVHKNIIIHRKIDKHPWILLPYLIKYENGDLRYRAELVAHQCSTVEN